MKKAPPAHLSTDGRRMWRELIADYELDDAGALALLQAACEAHDRAQQARRRIDRDGVLLVDRFNQKKPHPAVAIERDARGQMIAALKALRLAPEEEA
jgi:P27 family predicted phage terminase small subunit